METLIIHTENKKQLNLFKALAKALKVDVVQSKENYNPDFVQSLLKGREDLKNGKCKKLDLNTLWK